MAFRSLRTCTGLMPVKSPSSLLETTSRPSSMSCWVVLRYFVSLFVRPGCSVARTLAAPLFGLVLDGEGIVTKWSALAIKVLLAAHKSVSKAGYSDWTGSVGDGACASLPIIVGWIHLRFIVVRFNRERVASARCVGGVPPSEGEQGGPMARRYLLSIDGGGIRGIIPAVALAKLEGTTGRPARETFSFVAGTSTGAIIAAAIVAGVPATRMVELYVERAREIFTGVPILSPLRRIFTGSMYSTRKIRDVISEELGPEARGWSLNDAPIDLLITAKGVPDGKAWYFVRDNPRNSGCTGRLGLVDCTTASAAAPTYFEPWQIEVPPGIPSRCERVGAAVDGGVGVAGNPVYQACVEAFYYSEGYEPEETITISMGTGRFLGKQRPT